MDRIDTQEQLAMFGERTPADSHGVLGTIVSIVILLAGVALVVYRTMAQLAVGPLWDSYAFLANAAAIAGKSIGYSEPWRPPILSVFAAPAFMVGDPGVAAIQITDTLLTVAGLIAFYLLMRVRFKRVPSALGTVALLLSPPVWAWLGVGYSDTAAVSVSLWALYFVTLGTERNPWWYLAAFPAMLAAAMTRPTALLGVIPIGLFLLYRWRPFRQWKQVALGIVAAIALYVPFGSYYAREFGEVLFPFVVALRIAGEQLTGEGFVTTEPGAFPQFLLLAAGLLALTSLTGLAYRAVAHVVSTKPARTAAWFLSASLVAVTIFAQSSGNLMLRQATIGVTFSVLFYLFSPRDEDGRIEVTSALDAAMALTAAVFCDWLIHNPIQVPRYLIPILPGAIYMLVLGLESWSAMLALRYREHPGWHRDASVLMWGSIALLLVIAGMTVVPSTPSVTDDATLAAIDTAEWLGDYEPDPESRVTYSNVWPYTSWHLGAEARPMPTFEDDEAYIHELEKTAADYFVTFSPQGLEPTFTVLYETGSLHVMGRTTPPRTDLPQVMYLGNAWNNYIEGMTDYKLFLVSDSGAQGYEHSAFLDAYSAEDLATYDAVAAYGFRWRSRVRAEQTLMEYVEHGGALIIDASGNFAIPGFTIQEGALLGTAIQRDDLSPDASIEIMPSFLDKHPELVGIEADPFVGEDGGPWTGASYAPLAPVEEWTVLATVDGKPLVATQKLGQGKVFWIGYNLAWHAFITENADEAALVNAVFEEALASGSEAE